MCQQWYTSFVLVAALILATSLGRGSIEVNVDPRVELVTTVFRLADAGEFRMSSGESEYTKRVDAYFGAYRNHETVKKAAALREKYGIGFDAVALLAVNITDIRSMKERIPFDLPPKRWDSRWEPKEARAFLSDLRKFSNDTKYKTFFDKEKSYFAKATTSLKDLIAKHDVANLMQRFYGIGPKRPATVIVGMLCGGGNYGMSVEYPNGDLEMSPIFGADQFDKNGVPIHSESHLPTIIHEFSHPFVNPAVGKYMPQLKPAAAKLLLRLKDVYRAQGYSGEETVVIETMVRAVVAYIASKHLPPDIARNDLIWQRCAGFLATSDLVETLGQYEANRAKYKTLDDFMPVLCETYHRVTADPELLYSRCPKVTNVDTRWGPVEGKRRRVEIHIAFDQPMLANRYGSWLEGGEKEQTGKSQYDESKRVLTMAFMVEPNKKYTLCVNPQGWGSIGEKGYPALPSRHELKLPE